MSTCGVKLCEKSGKQSIGFIKCKIYSLSLQVGNINIHIKMAKPERNNNMPSVFMRGIMSPPLSARNPYVPI